MLRGKIDRADRELVEGWAFDPDYPKRPVRLSIFCNDRLVANVVANTFRQDLLDHNIGLGRCSFSCSLEGRLPRQAVTLRLLGDESLQELPGSPITLASLETARPGLPQAEDGLDGELDVMDRACIQGWARSRKNPDVPVSLLVSVNGQLAARVLANAYRADLEQVGYGNGRHAFSLRLANLSPLEPCTLRVQREYDGVDMPGSPILLEAARAFDEPTRSEIAILLGAPASDDDLKARLDFLAQQMIRLTALRAEAQGSLAERRSRQLFADRWSSESKPRIKPDPASPGQRALAPRVLVIDSRMPRPSRDAGSNAVLSHMQSLQRLGFEVSFIASDMNEARAALALPGIACYHRPWCASVEELLMAEVDGFDLVYIHRFQNTRYLPLLRMHLPSAWLLLSVADLSHLRVARQAAVEDRPELAERSQLLKLAEINAAKSVDAVISHSSHEAALLGQALPPSKIHTVAWSVALRPSLVRFAARSGLAFIGGYQHAPNVDAVHHLLRDIMPLVWCVQPDIVVHLVGSDMPDSLRRYAGSNVVIAGHVADLGDVFDRIRLTVAPLSYGAGVKGKVLDSLAAGIPCVCTPIAAEGIDLPPLLAGQIAATPERFAEMILLLHEDAAANAAAAKAGLRTIEDRHSDARTDEDLAHAIPRPLLSRLKPAPE